MADAQLILQMRFLQSNTDYIARNGSKIRLLPMMKEGGLYHCTSPASKTLFPVAHCHVEEIWYEIKGENEVWRKAHTTEEIVSVRANMKALFSSGRVTQYIKFYYMATCSAPLLLGIYLLNVSTPNVLFTTLMAIALATINGVICCSSINKSYHAV